MTEIGSRSADLGATFTFCSLAIFSCRLVVAKLPVALLNMQARELSLHGRPPLPQGFVITQSSEPKFPTFAHVLVKIFSNNHVSAEIRTSGVLRAQEKTRNSHEILANHVYFTQRNQEYAIFQRLL